MWPAGCGGDQVGQTGDGREGVVVHQTDAEQVEGLEVREVGQGEVLLDVVVCQHQVDRWGQVSWVMRM